MEIVRRSAINGSQVEQYDSLLVLQTHKESDCEQSRVRVWQVIEFSRQMGTGRSAAGFIENGSWQSVGAHSLSRVLLQIACGKH